MNKTITIRRYMNFLLAVVLLGVFPNLASATIQGVTGTSFTLTATADAISTSDGDSMWMWGYALNDGTLQIPGPTLIVNQGDTITVTLYNRLPIPVSIVFPGQTLTSVTGSSSTQAGLLTTEVKASPTGNRIGPVTYTFTASQPGTYMYYTGTRQDLEVEMGLAGTIIVRPNGFGIMSPKQAYGNASTAYDREYLFFLSEADPVIHQKVAFASKAEAATGYPSINTTKRHATDWFINGRNFPDTMADPNVGWLPTQPYNCMPMMHPGEKVLMRIVSAGSDFHPFHTHGQNHLVIARDGRLLSSNLAAANPVPDLAVSDFTTTSIPGETVDAIWGPWTGAKLGWDIYGTADINPHTCNNATGFDTVTGEYCPDHYKPIPVALPTQSEITIGVAGAGMWGGTPYLGISGSIPSTTAEQNPMAGYSFMWHSHSERELTTNNIFPGGMGTMSLVVPMGMPIP